MRNLEALSCTIDPRAGGQSVSKAVSIPSIAPAGTVRHESTISSILSFILKRERQIKGFDRTIL